MKSLVAVLYCAGLSLVLGGCFAVKGVVFDPSKGEIIPLNTERFVCKQGILFGELRDLRGVYAAKLVYTRNDTGTSYDLTEVFKKAVSDDWTPESWTKHRATMHKISNGFYASVESWGERQEISLMRVDSRSFQFVMPAVEAVFKETARRLNIEYRRFPGADARIALEGSLESIRIFLNELVVSGTRFDSYIECEANQQ